MANINHGTTSPASELGMIGFTDALGRLVSEPFNPADPRHRALMEVFADGCPECQAALHRMNIWEATQTSSHASDVA